MYARSCPTSLPRKTGRRARRGPEHPTAVWREVPKVLGRGQRRKGLLPCRGSSWRNRFQRIEHLRPSERHSPHRIPPSRRCAHVRPIATNRFRLMANHHGPPSYEIKCSPTQTSPLPVVRSNPEIQGRRVTHATSGSCASRRISRRTAGTPAWVVVVDLVRLIGVATFPLPMLHQRSRMAASFM